MQYTVKIFLQSGQRQIDSFDVQHDEPYNLGTVAANTAFLILEVPVMVEVWDGERRSCVNYKPGLPCPPFQATIEMVRDRIMEAING